MPAQANTDDLKEKDGYGELVGGKCGCLQKAFGLKFDTIEEAYQFLEDNDVEEADLKGQLPAGRRMAWDFRNYVKQYYDFIEDGDDGKYVGQSNFLTNRVRLRNTIQMKKTEYTERKCAKSRTG